jgi:endonuclease/exonuclease/phosphatase family metal-dependent hydrolase
MKLFYLIFITASLLISCGDSDSSNKPRTEVGLPPLLQEPGDGEPDTLRIGSLNMTVGFRPENLILADLSDSQVVYEELTSMHNEFINSKPHDRVQIIAQAIVDLNLDVVGLQEVLVEYIDDALVMDFLDTLMFFVDSFSEGALQYEIMRQNLNRVDLDVYDTLGNRINIDFWEGNTFLFKSSLNLLDSGSTIYNQAVYFTVLDEKMRSERGAQYIVVQKGEGRIWQIFNTHIEVQLLSTANSVQGSELNSYAIDEIYPGAAQLIIGDLNDPDGRLSLGQLTNEFTGMQDLWPIFGDTASSPTCCITWLDNPNSTYDRRLDYFLGRGILKAENLVAREVKNDTLWGADHAFLTGDIISLY